MNELGQCIKRISEPPYYINRHQCSKKAVVVREGKPYCRVHDPDYIKAKYNKKFVDWDKAKCNNCGVHPDKRWAYCPYCGTRVNKEL